MLIFQPMAVITSTIAIFVYLSYHHFNSLSLFSSFFFFSISLWLLFIVIIIIVLLFIIHFSFFSNFLILFFPFILFIVCYCSCSSFVNLNSFVFHFFLSSNSNTFFVNVWNSLLLNWGSGLVCFRLCMFVIEYERIVANMMLLFGLSLLFVSLNMCEDRVNGHFFLLKVLVKWLLKNIIIIKCRKER